MNPVGNENPEPATDAPVKPKRRWLRRLFISVIVILGIAAIFGLAVFLTTQPPADRMFRSKLESEWIAGIEHDNEEQVEEWKSFGEEGVDVLVRGLKCAQRPRERLYRKWNRKVSVFLLRDLRVPIEWLYVFPIPERDETAGDRINILTLLHDMETVAYSAAPSVIESFDDEASYVQNRAVLYFCGDFRENTPLSSLNERQRDVVFDYLLAGVKQSKSPSIRNNCALVLRHYLKRKDEIVPALLGAISAKEKRSRTSVIETLLTIAPEQSNNSEVVAALIDILNDPDDQIAWQAPALLGKMTVHQEAIVTELLKNMKSRQSLVATTAATALGNFPDYADLIIPALWEAHADPAKTVRSWGYGPSLKKLDPEGAAKAGIR